MSVVTHASGGQFQNLSLTGPAPTGFAVLDTTRTLYGSVGLDGSNPVGIGPIPNGFGIEVALSISLPGLDRATAQKLVDAAHVVCPYSNATRNNIDVTLTLA